MFDEKSKTVIHCYGKINLHLAVLNKRNDGFHNIVSVMTQIGVSDLLKLHEVKILSKEYSPPVVTIEVTGGDAHAVMSSIPTKENLITKAVDAYARKRGYALEVFFSIEKNIPAGAGMAGGSSNAAGALVLIDRQLDNLATKELSEIAAKVGSDIPFCLYGGRALATGRGEKIEQIQSHTEHHILIVNQGLHIDTPQAYGNLNRLNYNPHEGMDIDNHIKKIKDLASGNSLLKWKEMFYNDFEEAIFPCFPQIKAVKEQLFELGASFSLMTGTGSTVFGIFEDEKKARHAKKVLAAGSELIILTTFA